MVGVATAMVSGGPGALVWMWLSAAFGITSKFSECMLAIKYREVNANGEMSGGPMYTMKKAFKNKKIGAVLGWVFALFAVVASFGDRKSYTGKLDIRVGEIYMEHPDKCCWGNSYNFSFNYNCRWNQINIKSITGCIVSCNGNILCNSRFSGNYN